MGERILIVDDDEAMTGVLQFVLSSDNYEIETCNDPVQALQIARDWQPTLVLLDLMMPQLNGYELCRRIRQTDGIANVPIILLTAMSSIDEKLAGFEAGADDYITKPFNNAELKMRIAARVRRVHGQATNEEHYFPGRTVSVPLALVRSRSQQFNRSYRVFKRLFDIAACLMTVPLVVPILLIIALFVRLDSPGPVLFIQQRTGMDGKRFNMYKFRTMVKNAEELKLQYAHLNELTLPDFKITYDPRMTRVGKFLRRTSLDELPQLWNVLIGQMSLVGPRPTSFNADTYQLWQTERLEVLPGLTGLWQVVGRSEIDFVERVELDIEYIERQSFRLDMEILLQTVRAVIGGRGAS